MNGITGIVATDPHGAIGRQGDLPWHEPDDLKFFRARTQGCVCVMGRRTWESIGRPLPKRFCLVLTRQPLVLSGAALVVPSVETVLALAPFLNAPLVVMGGAQIYTAFQPHITRWIVTSMPEPVPDADAWMPADFLDGFVSTARHDINDRIVAHTYERGAT